MQDNSTTSFIHTVEEAFRFLQEKYPFFMCESRILDGEGAVVRYESPLAYVEVWYDALRGGDLSVSFGLLSESQSRVPFLHTYMASSSPALEHCIYKLAMQVAEEAQPLLTGDADAYLYRQQDHDRHRFEWWHEMHLRGIRDNAEYAWQHKDYMRVISLLESISTDLADVEKKRLAYARKHASK